MSSQPTTEVGKVLVNSALSPSKNIKNNSTASPKQPSQLPSRSSKRTAAIADQNSLEWAAKLKAKLNLDSPDEKGNNTVNVFDSLDDATIISHFSSVGVKFGPSNISAEIVLEGLRKGCVDSMSSRDNLVNSNIVQDDWLETQDEDLDFSREEIFSAVNDICGDIVESFSDECHSEGGDRIDLQHPHQRKTSRSRKKKKGSKAKLPNLLS